jgi:hypothetical protein
MFEIGELINDIITPVQNELGMPDATNLMLGTAAVESNLGRYLSQNGGGPALGIWQIEPTSNTLVLGWAMQNKPDIYDTLRDIRGRTKMPFTGVSGDINKIALQYNHQYNCAIARCLYYSICEPLPNKDDVEAMGQYWKDYYNRTGKGTVEKFVEKYNLLVKPFLGD